MEPTILLLQMTIENEMRFSFIGERYRLSDMVLETMKHRHDLVPAFITPVLKFCIDENLDVNEMIEAIKNAPNDTIKI